jgi:hypothetical protein
MKSFLFALVLLAIGAFDEVGKIHEAEKVHQKIFPVRSHQ